MVTVTSMAIVSQVCATETNVRWIVHNKEKFLNMDTVSQIPVVCLTFVSATGVQSTVTTFQVKSALVDTVTVIAIAQVTSATTIYVLSKAVF